MLVRNCRRLLWGQNEFYKVQSFDVKISIPFLVGQIDGYFNYQLSKEIWKVLSVYVANASLTLINIEKII
ncbi:hypothetical protein [Clostridium sp. FP1]|uniref:hypothetical protein n=1 Tax=Clostridium sp. FP1 TaxID=2724076 RepID=UPI001CCB657D|nr:hypothetical protein [Clostridium sp. FP1]MBZ9635472.1 hypothetical protein [Clostridium sp. FP1]